MGAAFFLAAFFAVAIFFEFNWLVNQFTTVKIETSLKQPKNFLIYSNFFLSSYFSCIDTNEGFITFSFLKFNQAIGQREQRIIFSDAYIFSGMVFGTALTNEDVTGDGGLTTVDFNTETLAMRVPTVLYTTFTFFVSHCIKVCTLLNVLC